MRAVVVVVLLAGCGRFDFARIGASIDAPLGDAAPADAAIVPAVVVHGSALPLTTGASASLAIPKTGAGNLLVVGVTQESGTTATVVTITDDAGNVYASTSERSIDTNCANSAEIWYAPAVKADASSVTVTMSGSVTIEVWVLELSGLGASPFDVGAVASSQPSAATIAAPAVTTSVPGEVVISTAATCGAISQVHAGSPFTALAVEDGEDTAYDVTPATGSYGALWSYSGGSWNASTAAFR